MNKECNHTDAQRGVIKQDGMCWYCLKELSESLGKELMTVKESRAALAETEQRVRVELNSVRARLNAAEAERATLQDNIGYLRDRVAHSEQTALEMAEKNEQMREAIQSLMDVQNGPPLITWKDEWESAMEKARQALERISSEPSSIASQHIARETLDKLKGQ